MATDPERSEAVIEEYKKRKLATSALHRIRALLHGFEQDRASDMRLALIGIIIILLLGVAAWFFLGSETVVVS